MPEEQLCGSKLYDIIFVDNGKICNCDQATLNHMIVLIVDQNASVVRLN